MQRPSATRPAEVAWQLLYRLLLAAARPLVSWRLRRRGRKEPAYLERIPERLGRVPAMSAQRPLWIHAVSAGETIAVVPLIEQLLKRYPEIPLLVTSTTPAGSGEVKRRLGDRVLHCYAPWDFNDAVTAFFAAVQPRGLILVETELWPNLLRAASERGLPIALVNGRLSERSARGYGRIGALTRGMLECFDLIGCQSPAHRSRFLALGAPESRVQALGSVKYDVVLRDDQHQAAAALRQRYGWRDVPVIIAASTHPGEEEQVLDAWLRVRAAFPAARLILVPRHPVRADEVDERVRRSGLACARQSRLEGLAPEIVIGDVMGSLLMLYGAADIAFVGGSLVPRGGHNPIEPALWGLPVVTGNHTFNFDDVMADFREAGAVREVGDADALGTVVLEWLSAPEDARSAGNRGRRLVDQQRGALERTLGALEPLLSLLRE